MESCINSLKIEANARLRSAIETYRQKGTVVDIYVKTVVMARQPFDLEYLPSIIPTTG